MDNITPKRGLRFLHAQWLRDDRTGPATCEVTRVAQGQVYYRMVDETTGELGGRWRTMIETFSRRVKAVLP